MASAKEPKKVLICDDDIEILTMLDMVLRYAGYEVIQVCNSPEIFTIIEKQSPDVVLLDLWMPALSGEKIIDQLKQNVLTRNIPVFIVSANTDAGQIAKRCGADGFMNKPFEITSLLEKIDSVLT